MNIGPLKLDEFGHTTLLAGAIFSDKDCDLFAYLLPGVEQRQPEIVMPTLDEWKKLVRQTDLKITEVSQGEKLPRSLVRKCERTIERRVSWKVYKRDNYTCRYCGNDDTPLTVDHLILWEELGPSIEENLVAACSKCNKVRGNTPYNEWLESDAYKIRSKKLSNSVKSMNIAAALALPSIQLRPTARKR